MSRDVEVGWDDRKNGAFRLLKTKLYFIVVTVVAEGQNPGGAPGLVHMKH